MWDSKLLLVLFVLALLLRGIFFLSLSSRYVRDEEKISLASPWELHTHPLQQGSPVEGEVGLPSS